MRHSIVCAGLAACLMTARGQAQNSDTTEQQKIEALIARVEGLKQAKFVRNGQEYDAGTAAEFLRSKWQARRSQIRTGDDFIAKVASESSTTGEPYLIRFRDGTEKKSRDFLLSELKALDAKQADTVAKNGANKRPPAKPDGARTEPSTAEEKPARSEPIELTVRQRDTRPVPGMKDIQIRLGDITEGQVLLSVITPGGDVRPEPRSVRQGDVVQVTIDGKRFEIRVVGLANALVGQDFATLSIAPAEEVEAGTGLTITLTAAPEAEFRTVREVVQALRAPVVAHVKHSLGKPGSGISAEIRAPRQIRPKDVAGVVESLLDAGIGRLSIEIER